MFYSKRLRPGVKDALKEMLWLCDPAEAACDGEGVTDKWHLSCLDSGNLSFHSVSLQHSWKGKDGRCSR